MAFLSVATALISGVFGMAQASYQAKVANMNAQIAEENAKRTIERSQIEQQDQDMMTRQALGEQMSVQSASGLSMASGSALLTRRAAARLGRMDALNVRQAGEIEAYNYKTQAMNFRAEASMAQLTGVGNLLNSFLGAGSSLIGQAKSTLNASRYTIPVPKPGLLS